MQFGDLELEITNESVQFSFDSGTSQNYFLGGVVLSHGYVQTPEDPQQEYQYSLQPPCFFQFSQTDIVRGLKPMEFFMNEMYEAKAKVSWALSLQTDQSLTEIVLDNEEKRVCIS